MKCAINYTINYMSNAQKAQRIIFTVLPFLRSFIFGYIINIVKLGMSGFETSSLLLPSLFQVCDVS